MTAVRFILVGFGVLMAFPALALLGLWSVSRVFAWVGSVVGVCRVCGCTDRDCRSCIALTGEPCFWLDDQHTICSRCVDHADFSFEPDLMSPDCSPLNARR